MNEGDGLLYKDQRTAEAKVDEWARWAADTLQALRELNGNVDSLALDNLITVQSEQRPR